VLNIIWHLLQHQIEYQDLGVDYFERQNLEGQKRAYVKNSRSSALPLRLSLLPSHTEVFSETIYSNTNLRLPSKRVDEWCQSILSPQLAVKSMPW